MGKTKTATGESVAKTARAPTANSGKRGEVHAKPTVRERAHSTQESKRQPQKTIHSDEPGTHEDFGEVRCKLFVYPPTKVSDTGVEKSEYMDVEDFHKKGILMADAQGTQWLCYPNPLGDILLKQAPNIQIGEEAVYAIPLSLLGLSNCACVSTQYLDSEVRDKIKEHFQEDCLVVYAPHRNRHRASASKATRPNDEI